MKKLNKTVVGIIASNFIQDLRNVENERVKKILIKNKKIIDEKYNQLVKEFNNLSPILQTLVKDSAHGKIELILKTRCEKSFYESINIPSFTEVFNSTLLAQIEADSLKDIMEFLNNKY